MNSPLINNNLSSTTDTVRKSNALFFDAVNDVRASCNTNANYSGFVTGAISSRYGEFLQLVKRWEQRTAACSIIHKMKSDELYQKILRLNKPIPLILRYISNNPSRIIIALYDLVNENPVPKSAVGDQEKVRNAWIKWGQKKYGLLR